MLFDGSIYLDDELLELLAQQAGLVPFVVVQAVGDAVVVPAGCAHQVRNLRSCIKVACDFVAPEHVSHCVRLTEDLRQLPLGHHRRQDVLSVRTILLYAACACFSTVDDHKKSAQDARNRERRLELKASRSQSNELLTPAAAAAASSAAAEPAAAGAAATASSLVLGEEVAAALML